MVRTLQLYCDGGRDVLLCSGETAESVVVYCDDKVLSAQSLFSTPPDKRHNPPGREEEGGEQRVGLQVISSQLVFRRDKQTCKERKPDYILSIFHLNISSFFCY